MSDEQADSTRDDAFDGGSPTDGGLRPEFLFREDVDGDIIAIDDHTWAIHGNIPVDRDVIIAEFDHLEDAEEVLASLKPVDSVKEGRAMKHPLIPVGDIPHEGTATVDLMGREVLVMLANGKPRAFVNVCMHHGGPLRLEGDHFTCQWHGAQYDARTGLRLSGPARPDARLIMLPTRVEEGVLVYAYDDK